MIVRSFLKWYEAAPAHERVEAVQMLAQAYLAGELGSDTPREAEAALTLTLDDPSLAVRRALAWALALSDRAPRHIIVALAHDHADVSALILARSPQLRDPDLIDCIRNGDRLGHLAISLREGLSAPVIAALAQKASPDAIVSLIENGSAELLPSHFEVIAERFEQVGRVREALIRRADLPAAVRQRLVSVVSGALFGFMKLTGWVEEGRASRLVGDAREAATIELAETTRDLDIYVDHLRKSGQLTPSLLLRSLLYGETALLGASLVCLAGLNPRRVASMMTARNPGPFIAAYHKAALPKATLPAFVAALEAIRELAAGGEFGTAELQRPIIERVLAACLHEDEQEMRPVLAMLRRFDAEAARAEARALTEQLKRADAALVIEAADAPVIELPLAIASAVDESLFNTSGLAANESAPSGELDLVAPPSVALDEAMAAFEAEFGALDAEEAPALADVPQDTFEQRLSQVFARMQPAPVAEPVIAVDPMPQAVAPPSPAPQVSSRLSDEMEELFAKAFAQDAAEERVLSSRPEDFAGWELRRSAA